MDILDAGRLPNAVRYRAGTAQVDFDVDGPPSADCPPGDLLMTMVEETLISYEKEFRKTKKSEICLHLSLI